MRIVHCRIYTARCCKCPLLLRRSGSVSRTVIVLKTWFLREVELTVDS